MWLYQKKGTIYEVGYLTPDEGFLRVESYAQQTDARQAVHFLNGGGA